MLYSYVASTSDAAASHPGVTNGAERKEAASEPEHDHFPSVRLDHSLPIVYVFFEHVEQLVHTHKLSERFLRLDDDAEQFAVNRPVPKYDPPPGTPSDELQRNPAFDATDVSVGDVLGSDVLHDDDGGGGGDDDGDDSSGTPLPLPPLLPSLLTFSLNLNPALRHQLSSEISALFADGSADFMRRGTGREAIRTVRRKRSVAAEHRKFMDEKGMKT